MVLRIAPEAPAVEMLSPAQRRFLAELALASAVAGEPIPSELIQDTAERIARVRASPEGREGLTAFLEKREAAWVPKEDPQAAAEEPPAPI